MHHLHHLYLQDKITFKLGTNQRLSMRGETLLSPKSGMKKKNGLNTKKEFQIQSYLQTLVSLL